MPPKPRTGFPNHLTVIRNRAGLSQAHVADRLGVTQPAYSNLEAGKSRLTVDRARTLARILNCQLWELADELRAESYARHDGKGTAKHFREPAAATGGKGRSRSSAQQLIADVALHDPVVRIVRDYAARMKAAAQPDLLMVIYAAVNKHIGDYEARHHQAASDDYIRGVVAAKFEQFTRR